METKRCVICGETKSLDQFNKGSHRSKDGKSPYCRHCSNEKSRKYHREHVAQIHERHRRNYWANPEWYRLLALQWQRENLDYARQQKRVSIEACRAQWKVKEAVRTGRLIRPTKCPRCGEQRLKIHAHHIDYTKPLDVEWMCSRCHGLTRRRDI